MIKKTNNNSRLYENILNWVKEQLTQGRLKEGDKLPSERALAAMFNVSRIPVHEALRVLEYTGIIYSHSRGMYIKSSKFTESMIGQNFAAQTTHSTVEKLFEVRIFLETTAAFYAAQRRSQDDLVALRDALKQMSSAISSETTKISDLIAASHKFHTGVIYSAKNPILKSIYDKLYDILDVSKHLTITSDNHPEDVLKAHELIFKYISAQDPENASKSMKTHLLKAVGKVSAESQNNNAAAPALNLPKYSNAEAADIFHQVSTLYIYTKKPHDYGTGKIYTAVEIHLLKHIGDHPGITPSELAYDFGRTRGAISQIIGKLENYGLIERTPHSEKKNRQALYLTPQGKILNEAHRSYDELHFGQSMNQLREIYSQEEIDFTLDVLKTWLNIRRVLQQKRTYTAQ